VSFPGQDEDIPGWGTGLDADLTLDYAASEPTGYRYFETSGRSPRYPFGYGLGYTDFKLVDAVPASTTLGRGDNAAGVEGVAVHVTLRNTGRSPGRDVVQLYGKAPGETGFRLMGFAALDVYADASAGATVAADPLGFRRWDIANSHWIVPPGDWELRVARNAADEGILCRITL
jgi:beta-glucosidase